MSCIVSPAKRGGIINEGVPGDMFVGDTYVRRLIFQHSDVKSSLCFSGFSLAVLPHMQLTRTCGVPEAFVDAYSTTEDAFESCSSRGFLSIML